MRLIHTILETYSTTPKKILDCLEKATIIIFRDGMYLVADENKIYYFGTSVDKQCSKQFYKFYTEVKVHMLNKYFFSKDITMYKNSCKEVKHISYRGYRKYIWLG